MARGRRAAATASVAWALAVWWLGEGLGGMFTGTASPVTGAPRCGACRQIMMGAAMAYMLILML